MGVCLKEVIIYNFKSFYGKITVSFKPFTAIIGPNGTGKSNIMEAISFVMGEKISNLRVGQLNDIISHNSEGTLLSTSAYVTAIFEIGDKCKEFTRGIYNSSNVYKINNQIVKFEFYMNELVSLGLNVKSKNFLIFQESTSISPKELSIMFDEISKSAKLKSQYEISKNKMQEINQELYHIIQKKKCLIAEKKSLALQQEEAKEYNLLQEEYQKRKTELELFRLFHIKTDLNNLKLFLNNNVLTMNKYEDEKKEIEIILEKKKKIYLDLIDQETMTEDNLLKTKLQQAQENAQLITAKDKILHLQKKISFNHNLLIKARNANEIHNKTMIDLQEELAKIETLKINLTQSISSELESQGSSLELDNAQIENYYLLKGKVQRECARDMKMLNYLKYEQENDQNKLDNEKQKKLELDDKKERLESMLKETEKRLERLDQYVINTEITLEEKNILKDNFEAEITKDKTTIEETKIELDKIINKLNVIKVDKFTVSRETQKLNTINVLKKLFPEVYGRLFTLCKSSHERYIIAVTKILWKHRDAIIVKTEKVAKQCIDYLKQQKIGTETFLPLDYLKVYPIGDQLRRDLRNMEDPKNVQLLYDVIEYYPKEISNAILFVTKNTLLCETSEDARRVAYEVHLNHRYTCVALDGSYYEKSGLISGGSVELSIKAAIWKDKEIEELKLKKETLIEKMKKIPICIKKQSELSTMNSEILSLNNKLKYSRADLDNIKKQIINIKKDIENIDNQLISIVNNIKSIQKSIDKRYKKIQDIENQIDVVERKIFSIFCRNINIVNIREYEKGRLRIHGQQKKREIELENQCNCIKNALDLEKHHNTEDEIIKYETAILTAEKELKMILEEESAIKNIIDKQKDILEKLNNFYINLKTEMIQMKNEVAECRRQIGIIAKLIIETRREHTIIAMQIKQKKIESNNILKNCQMEGIIIPMSNENILNDLPWTSLTNTPSSNITEQNIDNILSLIDYSDLSDELQRIDDDRFNNIKNELIKNIDTIKDKLKLIPAPNLKAYENFVLVKEKLNENNKITKEIRNVADVASKRFTKVKKKRVDRFMKCFNSLNSSIDDIYKYLVNNQSAQATLIPYNPEEPYLNDINYSCIAPGKRFHFLSSLSGGEQVLAMLTLLFAMHRYKSAPFIILDEIDANLDKINISNIVKFIRSNIDLMHFIIISLKKELFVNADSLVGVTARQEEELIESSVFIISLDSYK